GTIFTAEIVIADFKNCLVKITSETVQEKRDYHLHIAIAPTKMNDRMEWFLEKATEIGIDEITPVICDKSERKVIKKERFEKIIQSAMKQSLQAYLPILNEAMSFKQFLNLEHQETKYIAHCEETEKHLLSDEVKNKKSVLILIGPEGDFSLEEIKLAIDNNFRPVSLGETRLRTETAGVVAAHTMSLMS
ncbi:MAG: 16S rRNA (uracil(1498)-N(3))-methyltransferase, partial [Flavobacteriaceae bacterium]|nr:16S rRNA (uracil(1498)-N(3))-methyltransferase [Flavobacteriaceae bacterium]